MVKKFEEVKGVVYNPYIGFTSFQHFRGEKLYSDCITGRAGIASTETENYECYPIPEGVEENGREQGYYPDTTVAYIRILWKEFEPVQGQYNYDFVQGIIDKAREKGQTLMFRLMPHSTCARDDVPDWLKELIPCPARPDGMRVKESPSDPLYLELFSKAVEKLGERFDKDPVLDVVDVSLGGCWGESCGFPDEDLKKLMDIYVRVFPNTKLLGQLGNVNMLHYIGATRPIGWRADGTGSPRHMYEIFPPRIEILDPDHWKIAPVSFESYWWVSEWYRQGWDIDDIIKLTLSWHISTFNTKSLPIQFCLQEKMEYWLTKMGYRFYLSQIDCPEAVPADAELPVDFIVNNTGVAPIYNKLPFRFILKNDTTSYEFVTDIDICKWLPGENREQVALPIPNDLPAGSYQLCCKIGGGDDPVVKLATVTENDGEAFYLTDVRIQ